MGAQVSYFSPLADSALPECDAVWLPGGYPELHLDQLSTNRAMVKSIRAHHAADKPILAECGGMLYCLDHLDNGRGQRAPMLGLLPGKATLQPRLAALGPQAIELPNGVLRGHTFHYSRLETPLTPQRRAHTPDGRDGEAVFDCGSLWASYFHGYFPSVPEVVAAIFTGRRSI